MVDAQDALIVPDRALEGMEAIVPHKIAENIQQPPGTLSDGGVHGIDIHDARGEAPAEMDGIAVQMAAFQEGGAPFDGIPNHFIVKMFPVEGSACIALQRVSLRR